MKTINFCIFLCFTVSSLFADLIPGISDSRLVDWSHAGLYEESPVNAEHIITIYNTGNIDSQISQAISRANTLDGVTIIYFPSGTYDITSTIDLENCKKSGIIFQGAGTAGTEATILNFYIDKDSHCFNIEGNWSGEKDLLNVGTDCRCSLWIRNLYQLYLVV